MDEFIRKYYSAEQFSETATQIQTLLANYLTESQTAKLAMSPAFQQEKGQRLIENSLNTTQSPAATVDLFLNHSRRLHSPTYMGHQVNNPLPLASFFTWMTGLLNQGLAVAEMGPFAALIEQALVKRMTQKVGWGAESGGFVTNGGSLANLTALLAARNLRSPQAWNKGMQERLIVFCSKDAHYSIARAAGVLGMGTDQVVKVPLDAKRRMDPNALSKMLANWNKKQGTPFCLVGSACSTPTGAYDNLDALSAIAKQYGLWFHVDGAHGASVLFSKQYKERVAGIEKADSVSWDAHKMHYVPSLCTFLLFKDVKHSFASFEQDAPYLFDTQSMEGALLDGGLRTIECTKQAIAIPFWGIWATYGEEIFGKLLDAVYNRTRQFYQMLKASEDFKPLHFPEANILCFHYIPKGSALSPEALSDLQKKLRTKLVAEGHYYTTMTKLEDTYAFRVTIINPLTEEAHLTGLMAAIRELNTRI